MKAAFHFQIDRDSQFYDKLFYKILFGQLLRIKPLSISSKVLVGDLCAWSLPDVNQEHYAEVLIQTESDTWKRMNPLKKLSLVRENVFVVCFETIQKDIADKLHHLLEGQNSYLGAFEIDDAFEAHWWLYGECIGAKYRIIDDYFYIITDNADAHDPEYLKELQTFFESLLFKKVYVEYTQMRYTVFDKNHQYDNAKRAAQWRKSTELLFSSVIDGITGRLHDTAPDLMDKLWAMMDAFERAETGEQYAQSMTSCRRIFEYVADCLFPATDGMIDGRSLKKDKYKNRLMQFAAQELKSNTNIDLVITNTLFLFDEWNKLYDLSNKGVHDNTHRQECRRCIIRTVLLLDDLVSLRNKPFEFKTNIQMSVLDKYRE